MLTLRNRFCQLLAGRMTCAVILSLVLLGSICSLTSAAPDERPNVLVILVDDMGFSDLGCYGSRIDTPHLDRLAQRGIRYTQMYNTSKCWPTRISLLTGLYHNRTNRNFDDTAMVSEVLGPAGYHTWWSGKHHANFNPVNRGFDHFHGFLGGAINYWNPGNRARPGEPKPGWHAKPGGGWRAIYTWAFDQKTVKPFVPEKGFYSTDRFTDWALEWLDSWKGERPFFLYMAYNAPHWPLQAHPEDIRKYRDMFTDGYAAVRKRRYRRQVEMGLFDPETSPLSRPDWGRKKWSSLSKQEQHRESMRMAIHAAMLDRVDQNVGRLLEKLRDAGARENTLILFLSDNGASHERPGKNAPTKPWGSVGTFEAIGKWWAMTCNTPLRKWKMTSHEGGIRTPMIASWPAGIDASMRGKFYREPCHLVDLLPTWMQLAGSDAKYPGNAPSSNVPPVDGVSLVPSFSGESLDRTKPLFFKYAAGRAIRTQNWKLVRYRNKPWELYNFARNQTETDDVSGEHPERVRDMKRRWKAWFDSDSPN